MNLTFFKQHAVGLSLIAITWLIFFFPIISGRYVYFLDDLKIIYYPLETVYAQFQHDWQIPIWANEFGFGQPLLAWGQLGFFTPLHIVMRALFIPPLTLLQLSVASYFLIGSVGMFVFLLRRNVHQAAAAMGAVLFAYCGFNIGHLNHVNFYTSTMLLPLLLVAIDSCIQKVTLRKATTLALLATAIIVSGQPQVVLYVFVAAFVIGLMMFIGKPGAKVIGWTVYAGILAFLLSSFALFPLREFLPETDRAAGLPLTELFEFSYPPYDTITLILPYFFGDHSNYFGPKGFQELAAYLGIIPLMLAGAALFSWKTHRLERIASMLLIAGGSVLVLGKYSVVYIYLVEHGFITSIGVVGRFVFFFDVGMVLLAAIGLHDLLSIQKEKIWKTAVRLLCAIALPVLLVAVPFGIHMSADKEIQERFHFLFTIDNIFWLLIGIGAIATIAVSVTRSSSAKIHHIRIWALPVIAAVTLICYGWDYNPKVLRSQAHNFSPFIQDLTQYKEETKLPARLYAAEHLPVQGNPHVKVTLSDPISPKFSITQPLSIHREGLRCLIVPIQADSEKPSTLTFTIRKGLDGPIYYEKDIYSQDVYKNVDHELCFPPLSKENQNGLTLSLTSKEETNMKVFVTASESDEADAYFLRVQNPTPVQLARSKKPLSMKYTPQFPLVNDAESSLMMRHIQATAGASSARWIGALSIRPYREFIDSFFANDSDAFDGDGTHALTRNKKLVDMTGITHFTQLIEYGQTNDPMLSQGYELIREADTGDSLIRLYKNPTAYPKAYVVPNGEFIASNDEVRFRLRDPLYNPKELVFLSGPKPPQELSKDNSKALVSSATILSYEDTRVDIQVTSNKDAFLVLADATTPQWHTFIDDTPASQLRANSLFKVAQIPSGTHTVSFRYESPAINMAKNFTIAGLILTVFGYAYPLFRRLKKT